MEKKKRFAFIVLLIGLVVLVAGLVFLLFKVLNDDSGVQDGEYLVGEGEWTLVASTDACDSIVEHVSCPLPEGVIWKFTEIGRGILTTNNHLNDYEFIWAIEDGRLLVETNWLHSLENEYDYRLDQEKGELTLMSGGKSYQFKTTDR